MSLFKIKKKKKAKQANLLEPNLSSNIKVGSAFAFNHAVQPIQILTFAIMVKNFQKKISSIIFEIDTFNSLISFNTQL